MSVDFPTALSLLLWKDMLLLNFLNAIFMSDARVMALGMAMSVVGLQRVGKSETREFWKFAQFQLKKITSYLSYLKM